MPCENYREALIEAAAADTEPSRELRLHLDACPSCGAAFAQERQLFAALDSGVCANANSEIPASLLSRVRAGLNERPAPQRSWILAGAALAAVAALVIVFILVHGFGRGATETNPQMIAAVDHESPAVIPPFTQAIAPSETTSSSAKSSSRRPIKPATLAKFEQVAVLIPAGQKQAIEALLAGVQQGKVETNVFLTEKPEEALQELQVSPLEISPIEVKPLADVSPESPSEDKTLNRLKN
jgi:hypothetical protein